VGKGKVHHSYEVTSIDKFGNFIKYTSRGKEALHGDILVTKHEARQICHYALAMWIIKKLLRLIKPYRHFCSSPLFCEATTEDVRQLQGTATLHRVPASKQHINNTKSLYLRVTSRPPWL